MYKDAKVKIAKNRNHAKAHTTRVANIRRVQNSETLRKLHRNLNNSSGSSKNNKNNKNKNNKTRKANGYRSLSGSGASRHRTVTPKASNNSSNNA